MPPLKRLAPQAHARDENGSAAPALRRPAGAQMVACPRCMPPGDPGCPYCSGRYEVPAHARERAEAGLEPDLDTAFDRMRDLAAVGMDDLRRHRTGGAA